MKRSEYGISRPMATAYYARVKNRNRSNPSRVDEEFELTIPCLCAEGHEPIGTKLLHDVHCTGNINIFLTKGDNANLT